VAVVPYVRSTHVDGQSWSAAKANQLEAGVNDVSYAPAVRVTHNTTQSITSAVETSLAFNTERFDQAGNAADTMHDNVTNNSRLTCRYAGVYQITAHVEWATTPTTSAYIRIRLNGATNIAMNGFSGGTIDYRQMHVSTLYAMAVNDYVEVRVNQGSGAGVNINSTANYSPEFMMVRVG